MNIFSSEPDDDEMAEKRHRLDQYIHGWRTIKHENGAPMFAPSGMMLDAKGNRSIFDDVDE